MAYDHARLFKEICDVLKQMPHTSLTEISRRFGVERHTLRRTILERTQKTFREFRRDLLLIRTEELMCEGPNRTLKEISFMLGYDCPRSFTRFIKVGTGHPPSVLRSLPRDRTQQKPKNVLPNAIIFTQANEAMAAEKEIPLAKAI